MQAAATGATALITNPAMAPVPVALWMALKPVLIFHKTWRYLKRIELYTKPENFVPLAAGHVAQFALRDSAAYRVIELAAQGMVIANRLFDCINQSVALAHAHQQWVNAIKGNYLPFTKPEWQQSSALLSPSSVTWLKGSIHGTSERVRLIAVATANLVVQFFMLSMTVLDLIEAFSPRAEDRQLIVAEIFANARESMEKFVENQKRLKSQLIENKVIVVQMLSKIGVKDSKKADQLIHSVSTTIEYAAAGVQTIDAGSKAVTNVARNLVFEAADLLGMAGKLPNAMVPPSPAKPAVTPAKAS